MYFLYIRLLFFLLVFISFNSMAYEEASYSIVSKNNIYEIRNYNERLAIQVDYTNQNNGFQTLFSYISGSNIDSKKIKMTVPATQYNNNGRKIMQFFLPSSFTKKNAPVPIDEKLKLIIIDQGYYAVIKYSGRATDKNFDRHKKILKDMLLKDNIETSSTAIKATYNGPFTLPFLRRNEAMFRINWK